MTEQSTDRHRIDFTMLQAMCKLVIDKQLSELELATWLNERVEEIYDKGFDDGWTTCYYNLDGHKE